MLKNRVSGKLRKNKANSWMKKYRNMQNLLEKRKGGLETYEVRGGHRDGTGVCRKKERVMIKTYGKQRRKDADILTSIFYIFTLSRI